MGVIMGLFSFSGRAGRLNYWGISIISSVILFGLAIAVGNKMDSGEIGVMGLTAAFFGIILSIWVNLAVTVRRFHDRGKSGLWYFALLIPFIGLWFAIELMFFGGVDESNEYGSY
jgi:uncharacterized membrane protein YhaH (DUF805 family)